MIRLNKYLASLGIASRRGIDALISQGEVTVNDHQAKLGDQIDPSKDQILVKGKAVNPKTQLEYYLVNKPTGYVSTTSDPQNRRTITSLVSSKARLYPVGRLDQDSEGLVLLTNDGELTNLLTHPKYHLPKTYEVVLEGKWTDTKKVKLETGIKLKDGLTAPAQVKIINLRPRRTVIHLTLFEGKNRQIRRMASALNLEVVRLQRIALGPLKLESLKPGESRPLLPAEISALKSRHS